MHGFPMASDLYGERASDYPVQCTAPIRFSLFHSDGTRTTQANVLLNTGQ